MKSRLPQGIPDKTPILSQAVRTFNQASLNPKGREVKISPFQKSLLARWLNAANIWGEQLTTSNIMQEMCTGILLCSILNSHQPKLNILQGLNPKARVKSQCINNIEKAIQVLYNKSVPVRFIPTAEEIFEAENN